MRFADSAYRPITPARRLSRFAPQLATVNYLCWNNAGTNQFTAAGPMITAVDTINVHDRRWCSTDGNAPINWCSSKAVAQSLSDPSRGNEFPSDDKARCGLYSESVIS